MNEYNKHTDSELFRLIGIGDTGAFTQIFNRYSERLYAYALKISKSEIWAEEIVQDVWTQIWINHAEFSNLENPSAYLFRTARNRCLDWLRRNKLEVRLQYYLVQNTQSIRNTTEQQVEYRYSSRLIDEAIQTLPSQRKVIFELKHMAGMSYEEVAETLKISKNTVRNQMISALKTIRQHLREKGDIIVTGLWASLLEIIFSAQ